ncbi:SAM-dependent methyltransferase [Streptacidiphilus pinicola]|uniref:SAM-dependent methyltransferase n=1 Tax=Streptacidiphilus pinicola TaxID=2219663 RepID=UPI00140319C8|nr:SAM-dependent methyltransferase [Streptacidiphilus pinicola]
MSQGPGPVPSAVDPTQPCIARVYDCILGGTVNFEADRQAARRLAEAMPDLPNVVRVNRAFAVRAVRLLAAAGIRQFLDLGSGLATRGAAHEVTREAGVEDARVLYVDHDPVVVAHNQLLLPEGTCAALRADLRDTAGVLGSPQARRLFDPDRPTAVLMIAVLHGIPHAGRPADVVARYCDALTPGSCLALSHAEDTQRLAGTFQAARVHSQDIAPIHLRTRSEIAAFFNGWELVEPGLVPTRDWRADLAGARYGPARLSGLAGVGCKPWGVPAAGAASVK